MRMTAVFVVDEFFDMIIILGDEAAVVGDPPAVVISAQGWIREDGGCIIERRAGGMDVAGGGYGNFFLWVNFGELHAQ